MRMLRTVAILGGCWREAPSSCPPWKVTCWLHDEGGRSLDPVGTFHGCLESDPGGTCHEDQVGTGSAWSLRSSARHPGVETHWGTCAWESSGLGVQTGSCPSGFHMDCCHPWVTERQDLLCKQPIVLDIPF